MFVLINIAILEQQVWFGLKFIADFIKPVNSIDVIYWHQIKYENFLQYINMSWHAILSILVYSNVGLLKSINVYFIRH